MPAYDKPELAGPRNINYRDLVSPESQIAKTQRGFEETSSLKPSSRDKRFRRVLAGIFLYIYLAG
jgi:hypothetical protein